MPNSRPLPPVLRVWTNRNYAFFMGGCIPNYITYWMQRVGIGWLAWEMTHSPLWLGILAAMDLAPLLLLAPIAGAVVDRWDPLKQFRIAQFCILLHAAALPLLYFSGNMSIGALLGLTAFYGIVYPFMSSARLAVLPRTMRREDLASGIALDSALFHGSRFLGPAIAGVLIPIFGVGATLVVNAFGSAWLQVCLLFVKLASPEGPGRKARNIFRDVGEAFSYVRHHGGIGPIFLVLVVVSTFTRPVQDMMPGIAGSIYHAGPVGLAWLTSSLGVGAMISGAWIAFRGRIAGLTQVIINGALLMTAGIAGLVSTDIIYIGIPFAVLTGFSLNTMSTSVQTLVQASVPDDMRGRVMSLYIMIFRGAPAMGSLILGAVSTHIGLQVSFTCAAVLSFTMWVIFRPRRRAIAAELEQEATPRRRVAN